MGNLALVAAEASPVVTAFTTAANDMKSVITDITPIAVGVIGAGLVVTFGVKFFKRIAGKA